MNTQIKNFLALNLLLLCSFTLTLKMKSHQSMLTSLNPNQLGCFNPTPNFFQSNTSWTLPVAGSGEIDFKAKGSQIGLVISNTKSANAFQYLITINQDNMMSTIIRGDNSVVCKKQVAQINLYNYLNWQVFLDPSNSKIVVYVGGLEHFSCVDKNGWNAPAAQYFSINGNVAAALSICTIVPKQLVTYGSTGCIVPDPDSYQFQSDWTLNNGSGEITFKGRGREAYVQINNEMNSNSYQYWININGLENTKSMITRGDSSVLCQLTVPAIDTTRINEYRIVLNSWSKDIQVYINNALSFSCHEDQDWNAPVAKYYSFSKNCCNYAEMCSTKSTSLFGVYQLTGQFINASTGQKISPLTGASIVIIDSTTNKAYTAIVNPSDSTFTTFVPAGDYTITGNATYFITSSTSMRVTDVVSMNLVLTPVPFKLTGQFINATTAQKISPLSGASVTVTDNNTNKSYSADINTTDSTYSLSLPNGDYTITGSATEYVTTSMTIRLSGAISADIVLPPAKDNSSIVLTWNLVKPTPLDLDLYVFNLKNGEKVYYQIKRSPSGQLALDADDVKQGPETVTVRLDAISDFQIAVKNYNKVIPLNASGAKIEIYKGNYKVTTIPVPVVDGQQTYASWNVGVYSSAAASFTPSNVLTK
jgi:hypothetical protein